MRAARAPADARSLDDSPPLSNDEWRKLQREEEWVRRARGSSPTLLKYTNDGALKESSTSVATGVLLLHSWLGYIRRLTLGVSYLSPRG